MTHESIGELASRIVSYYKSIVSEDDWKLLVHTVRELSMGEPVEPARLAQLIGEPVKTIRQRLENVVEWDSQGRVVGEGLTLIPTQHEFELNGRTMWVWCAGDAIVFPMWINQAARIKSPCAVTGEQVEVTVTPEAVTEVSPPGAVASLITHDPNVSSMADVRSLICSGQVFFKSAEMAKHWRLKHPNAVVLPVRECFAVYKQVHDLMWASALTASK